MQHLGLLKTMFRRKHLFPSPGKGKAITVQAWISTRRWYDYQPYASAAFTHQEIFLVLISVWGWVDSRAI